jgi:hypothetical protein
MVAELTVDDVLINQQLDLRPVPPPRAELEIHVLRKLAQKFASGSPALMDATVESVCELCSADSAGITVVERLADGSDGLQWVATTGRIGQLGLLALPREHSPCGTVMDRHAPQLFSHLH